MLEKIKSFYEEHKDEFMVAACTAGALGIYTFGVVLGYKYRGKLDQAGLNACFIAKPELKPMLMEALQQVNDRING